MQVILLQDVSGVGVKGDLKEVSNGYALNYLIPRSLAKFASPQMVEQAHAFRRRKVVQQSVVVEKNRKALKLLEDKKITITGKVNEQGHLFAQIHENDVALAIHEQYGIDASIFTIALPEPIKALGTYKVTVSTTGVAETVLEVVIVAED